MKDKSELRLPRLIPCLLAPPLTAALFCGYVYSPAFFALLSRLFGETDNFSFLLVLFPLFVLALGLLPAFLLKGRETRLWLLWSAVFYAVFFLVYVIAGSRRNSGPSPVLWLMTAPMAFFWHALPSGIAAGLRALFRKRS